MSQQGGVGNMLWKLIAAICVLIAAIAFARASVKKSDGNEGRKLYDNLSLFGLSPEGYVPTNAPTRAPTISPSPTGRPTATPSREPSTQPSQLPSTSISPSTAPSSSPTMRPSESPTNMPSPFPSSDPTMQPSPHPSSSPTTKPSASPSSSPTGSPSSSPTGSPSSSPSSFPSQSPTEFFAETVFYAIADTPYNLRQKRELPGQIASIPDDAAFLIHLGDIKSSSAPCDNATFSIAEGMLSQSKVPAMIVIGDNEWNDCSNPDAAFALWKSKFVRFDRRFWPNSGLDVTQMPGRPESFSFIIRGTLFIGLNHVGSPVVNWKEWNNRTSSQLDWTIGLIEKCRHCGAVVIFAHANLDGKHRRFVDPLVAYVRDVLQNSIPIMYMGGDNHSWLYEPNYKGQSSFLRVRKTGGTSEQPLRVVVNPGAGRFDSDFGLKASTETAFQLTRFPTTSIASFGARMESKDDLFVAGGIASEDLDDDLVP